jgi:hypothetical protein
MKKNSFIDRMEREKQAAMIQTHRFTRQLMVDLTFIALNKRFGLGAKRLTEFANDLRDLYAEYADLWNGDTADTEYSRAALDAKLQQIFGPDFHPWDMRYSE